MLSLRDCLDLADVSEAEIAAIARHENIPQILAVELGQELMRTPEGVARLQRFICDDIKTAQRQHRCRDCEAFSRTLAGFLDKRGPAGQSKAARGRRFAELLAVGRGEAADKADRSPGNAKAKLLEKIRDAKRRSDCCDCIRHCLKLAGTTK